MSSRFFEQTNFEQMIMTRAAFIMMIIKLSTFFDLRATSHIFRAKAGHIIWITVPSLSFCLECSWCGAISSDYFGADHFLPQKPY
jgi:hypothetical protein